MRKFPPIVFLLLGFVFIYSGIQGRTGTVLASLLTPAYVNVKDS